MTHQDDFARKARALRGTAKLDEVARAARRKGAKWHTGRVADIESGRAAMTISTLVLLAAALGEVRQRPVTLADLVSEDLAPFFRGEPVELPDLATHILEETDMRLAKTSGLPAEEIARRAQKLWGRSLQDERDARSATASNAQKRGIVTRQLMRELINIDEGRK